MSQQGEPESRTLPSEAEFVVYGNLDERYAWKNFGGLTLEQAKEKFAENPLHYWEDFMYMGANAFAYYFPVLDEHLRSVPDDEEPEHDYEAAILGYAIRVQFEANHVDALRPLMPSVLALAEFVQTNLRRFGWNDEERLRVAEEWKALVDRLLAIASR